MSNISQRVFRIVDGAWRHRYTIVLPILILPVVGLLIGLSSPKHYTSHTSMLIQETAKMNPFLEDFAVSAMLKERAEGLKTLLHSRHILNEVATELGLVDKDSSNLDRDGVIAQLSSNLSMQFLGKDLIRIDYTSYNQEGMEETLKVVSKHFVEQLLAPERSSINDSTSFLSKHLERQRRELDEAEKSLYDFKSLNAEALPELHTANVARLNQLKQAVAEKKAELAGAVGDVGDLKHLLSKTNPVIGKIEEKIIAGRSELALLKARYTEKHSKVQAVRRTLRRLEAERKLAIESSDALINSSKLWDMASARPDGEGEPKSLLLSQLGNLQNAKRKSDSLTLEINRLDEMIEKLEVTVKNFGKKESDLIRLQRDLNVKRQIYDDLLERYELALVTGSLGEFEESKRVKVIDRPFTPSKPANIHVVVFFIAGIVAGILLGIGMAILKELADTTVRYSSTLEELVSLPVITRIPKMG